MNIVLGTVVYPQAAEYLNDYLRSVNSQTDKSFEMVVMNDGVEGCLLEAFIKSSQVTVNVIDCEKNAKPFENRIELMKTVKNLNYDYMVMLDIDDTMSGSRMEEYKKQFKKEYTFFYNELREFDGKKVFGYLPDETKGEEIRQSNYLGLSNTGLNMDRLGLDFIESLYQGNTSVFDWYLFERILLNGGYGRRIIKADTYYRIHENNLAGIAADVQKELEVKKDHYYLLREYNSEFNDLYEKYLNLSLDEIEKCKSSNTMHYWWGNLKM